MALLVFTREQVRLHDSVKDLWVIFYNRVYDVTDYIDHHPGGAEVLINCGGVDATELFEDVDHSDDAFVALGSYLIGELCDQDKTVHQTSRDLFKNADAKAKRLKQERLELQRDLAKQKKLNAVIEIGVIVVLVIILIGAIGVLVSLQRTKWESVMGQ